MFKRMSYFLIFLLVASIGPAIAQTPAHLVGPRIVFDHETVDIGEVERGTIKDIPFIITNKGDQPLKIKDIDLSCGCLSYDLSSRSIAPRSKAIFKVKLASAILHGQFSKEIYMKSNDPSAPRKTLAVTGFSRSTVAFEPMAFAFGTIKRDKAHTKTVKFYDMVDFGVLIKEIKQSNPLFKVKADPFDAVVEKGRFKGKKGFTITVTIPVNYPLGELSEYIVVYSNLDSTPQIRLSVKGEVIGDVRWLPSTLTMALVRQERGARKRIKIKSASGRFEISKIEHSEPFIQIRAYEKTKGNYLIIVEVIPDAPPGPFNDEVLVFEKGSPKPVIRIPVYGLVRGKRPGKKSAEKPKPVVPQKLKKGQSIKDLK